MQRSESAMTVSFDLDRFSRTLAQAAPDAVIYADAGGLIRFWNNAAERVFGFSEAEALGQSLDIIIPEHLRARHWNGYAETMRTGKTRYGSGDLLAVPALRKGGVRVSVEFTVLPVRDEHGSIVGVAAILRDVTKRFDEIKAFRKRLVRLDTNMTALRAVRDVRAAFSWTIELIESFHAANPDHRIGPFAWARAHVWCEASQVRDVSDHSRLHEAFSFTWRGIGWLPLPVVHGFITVRPNGQLTRLTLDGQYVPPYGILGHLFDVVLGRRLAQLALDRMANDMASYVERREEQMRADHI
jgi:PAS domain S-box-containing protein